jgi:hypothetical protein
MGNNSLTLGYAKDDSDTTGDNDVTSVELIHNFSSRESLTIESDSLVVENIYEELRYGTSRSEHVIF